MPATIITFTTPIAFEGDYEKRLVTTVTASKRTSRRRSTRCPAASRTPMIVQPLPLSSERALGSA